MQEDVRFDHTLVVVPCNEGEREAALGWSRVWMGLILVCLLVGIFSGAFTNLLFWAGCVLALFPALLVQVLISRTNILYPPTLELEFHPAQIRVRYGRKELLLHPDFDQIAIQSVLLENTLRIKARDVNLSIPVQLRLEEEKQLWRHIDKATRMARERGGLRERDVPAALQKARTDRTRL